MRGLYLTPAEYGQPDGGRVSLAGNGQEARARSVPSTAARKSLGINETDPTHDTALAAQYPDRSLVWIDPETGAPQGTGLVIGLQPVPLDADFIAAGGTTLDFYFNFDVADDGVIYTGYKNKIVRYAPDGNGGFLPPTVAFTKLNDGSAYWQTWRWENIRAHGAGADTVLMGAGKTWRDSMGYTRLDTDDGLTFYQTGYFGAGGGGSSIVPDRNFPEDVWVYSSVYPGSSNGIDSRFGRKVGMYSGQWDYVDDADFAAAGDPDAAENEYRTQFITDVDAHADRHS